MYFFRKNTRKFKILLFIYIKFTNMKNLLNNFHWYILSQQTKVIGLVIL